MLPRRTLTIIAVLFGSLFVAEGVGYGQLPLRGRYVRRDGLFHVERFRWGGGQTANGVAAISAIVPVLNNAITTFGSGKGLDDEEVAKAAAAKSLESADTWRRYEEQQASANRLLAANAKLVNL